jgi:hypothetical protein
MLFYAFLLLLLFIYSFFFLIEMSLSDLLILPVRCNCGFQKIPTRHDGNSLEEEQCKACNYVL